MGISEAFYMPAGLALIADYHQGKTRSLAIGIHITGVYLGQAFGGFGATIAKFFSWQFTFQFFGLIGVVYSLVLIFFIRERKAYTIHNSERATFKIELSNIYKSLAILFSNVAFWVIIFWFSAPSFPGWAVKNWLPTLIF